MNYEIRNINQFKPQFNPFCFRSFRTNKLRLILMIFSLLSACITVLLADQLRISYTINYPERFTNPKSKLEIEFERPLFTWHLDSSRLSNHIKITPPLEGTCFSPFIYKLVFFQRKIGSQVKNLKWYFNPHCLGLNLT